MGVLFQRHDEREGVLQNLFDGSLFINHPELRDALLNRYCVRLAQRAYYSDDGSLCQDCYYSLDPDDQ
jgi:hypothetical protein